MKAAGSRSVKIVDRTGSHPLQLLSATASHPQITVSPFRLSDGVFEIEVTLRPERAGYITESVELKFDKQTVVLPVVARVVTQATKS